MSSMMKSPLKNTWHLRCLYPWKMGNVCRNGIMSSMMKSPRKNMATALFESAGEGEACRNGIMSSMMKSPQKNMATVLFESAEQGECR